MDIELAKKQLAHKKKWRKGNIVDLELLIDGVRRLAILRHTAIFLNSALSCHFSAKSVDFTGVLGLCSY